MGILKNLAGLLLASAFVATVSQAHAAFALEPAVAPLVTVTTTDAVAPVFGQASPTLTFTFDEPYGFTSMLFEIGYDPTKMTFNQGLSTAVFMSSGFPPLSLEDLVILSGGDFGFTAQETNPGQYSLLATFASQSHVLPAGSSLTLTGVFDLTTLAPGETTPVALSGVLTSTAADADPFAVNQFDTSVAVTAVPEPEAWLMLLGGLGLLASRVRRHKR